MVEQAPLAETPIDRARASWQRMVPAVRLVRAIPLSFDGKKLALALMALGLLQTGFTGLSIVFSEPSTPWRDAAYVRPVIPFWQAESIEDGFRATVEVLVVPVRIFAEPLIQFFGSGIGLADHVHAAFAFIWASMVLGFFGTTIARIAVVGVASEQRVGIATALKFTMARATHVIGSPLVVLAGALFFAALISTFGLIYWIPGIGSAIAGPLSVIPLVMGLVMAILLLGLGVAWPLMSSTIAAEGEDLFDALSRSFSYSYQRPISYLGLWGFALLIGCLGLTLVVTFWQVVVAVSRWSLGLLGPDAVIAEAFDGGGFAGTGLMLGQALVFCYGISFFWTASGIIYLLMREQVDQARFDDVFQPEDHSETFASSLERNQEGGTTDINVREVPDRSVGSPGPHLVSESEADPSSVPTTKSSENTP